MKRFGILAIALQWMCACASDPHGKIPCEVAIQLPVVEAQIYRQGFTCARLPKGTTVGAQFLFDNFFSEDQLLESRRCTYSTHALSFSVAEGDPVFLFADENRRRDRAGHFAGLSEDGTLWANESYASMDNPEFTRLPSRDAIERRRADCMRR